MVVIALGDLTVKSTLQQRSTREDIYRMPFPLDHKVASECASANLVMYIQNETAMCILW